MIGWMHKMREATVILLQFVAVCSLLSMVCATTPELPAGETIGQWVWFGKAVLVSTGCITASCLLQLLGKLPGQIFCVSGISLFMWLGA